MTHQVYKKSFTPDQALEKLRKFCAYQERCHQEIIKKLYEWSIYKSDQDQIISQLITENFLNETRFAIAYAGGKSRIKKWSKYKILSELKRRNISAYNIKKGMAEIEESEYQANISALIQKKSDSLDKTLTSFEKNNKISQYMARKGYQFAEFKDYI